jgi:hypothetical protein
MNIDREREAFFLYAEKMGITGDQYWTAFTTWQARASLMPTIEQIDEILEHCDNACNDDGSSLNRFEYAQAIHKLMEEPK